MANAGTKRLLGFRISLRCCDQVHDPDYDPLRKWFEVHFEKLQASGELSCSGHSCTACLEACTNMMVLSSSLKVGRKVEFKLAAMLYWHQIGLIDFSFELRSLRVRLPL